MPDRATFGPRPSSPSFSRRSARGLGLPLSRSASRLEGRSHQRRAAAVRNVPDNHPLLSGYVFLGTPARKSMFRNGRPRRRVMGTAFPQATALQAEGPTIADSSVAADHRCGRPAYNPACAKLARDSHPTRAHSPLPASPWQRRLWFLPVASLVARNHSRAARSTITPLLGAAPSLLCASP